MTQRLYYTDSFFSEFDASVTEVRQQDGRMALVLDRSAFYPTSGGQVFDTGVLRLEQGQELRVCEVVEDEGGEVLHFIEEEMQIPRFARDDNEQGSGVRVHGIIDLARRRDHMQQHSGQHVLSAAFVRLFKMQTVSFHMGDESCTIDLGATSVTDAQAREAEREANRIVLEDLPVEIRFAAVDAARAMGVRKIPDHVEGELRLIDMGGYDLNACGGTHVARTGQIGAILLRKTEKVKQGVRVEFVCGERAVRFARRDYDTLVETAAVYSAHIWEVPTQVRKALEEVKAAQKERKKLLKEISELQAREMLAETAASSAAPVVISRVFPDRELNYVKLLAQKLTSSGGVVALLGAGGVQPGIVFAQSAGGQFDMGALMKEAMAALGGRGGGNRELAQGGAANAAEAVRVIEDFAARLRSHASHNRA